MNKLINSTKLLIPSIDPCELSKLESSTMLEPDTKLSTIIKYVEDLDFDEKNLQDLLKMLKKKIINKNIEIVKKKLDHDDKNFSGEQQLLDGDIDEDNESDNESGNEVENEVGDESGNESENDAGHEVDNEVIYEADHKVQEQLNEEIGRDNKNFSTWMQTYDNPSYLQIIKKLIINGSDIIIQNYVDKHVLYFFIITIKDPEGQNRIFCKIGYTADIIVRIESFQEKYKCNLYLVGLRTIKNRQFEKNFHKSISLTKKYQDLMISLDSKSKDNIYIFDEILYKEFNAIKEYDLNVGIVQYIEQLTKDKIHELAKNQNECAMKKMQHEFAMNKMENDHKQLLKDKDIKEKELILNIKNKNRT
jgi:hypothetical protein